jgi:AcrR family transcriptional regulator
MSKRVPRLVRTEDTRRRLLEAARRVFLKRGWFGTSLEMIVREAGLTKGAVYSRFKSKADLFLALLEERIGERIGHGRDGGRRARIGPSAAAVGRKWDDGMAPTWLDRVGSVRLTPQVPAPTVATALRPVAPASPPCSSAKRTRTVDAPIPADDLARASMAL